MKSQWISRKAVIKQRVIDGVFIDFRQKGGTVESACMEAYHIKRGLGFTPDDSVEVTVAPNAGACFGVVRAIKLGHAAAQKAAGESNVYSFGPLIHNPSVVAELEGLGVRTVTDANNVDSGTVILRSHGVQKEIEAEFKERGVSVVDATCPLVKKPQRIATSLSQKGYYLVVVGDSKHPEVKGVLSYFGRPDYLVTYNADDLDKIPASVDKVGIIAQTTIELSVLERVIERAKSRFADVAVHNTICDATSVRQSEALALAKGADVVVVVGGKNSSNTCKLVKICRELQPSTHHIEEIEEISQTWFQGKKKIGVTGGASTPHEFVDKVAGHIAGLVQSSPA